MKPVFHICLVLSDVFKMQFRNSYIQALPGTEIRQKVAQRVPSFLTILCILLPVQLAPISSIFLWQKVNFKQI